MQRQPHWSAIPRPATWMTLLQRQPGDLVTSFCFGSYVSAADTLVQLIKASAMVKVYSGHYRTSYLPRINSLFIMCIGIIRNNSLVGGRAWAESNPSHWAHHALLHMAAECDNHSDTRAGDRKVMSPWKTCYLSPRFSSGEVDEENRDETFWRRFYEALSRNL